jgi:hypothetical protein
MNEQATVYSRWILCGLIYLVFAATVRAEQTPMPPPSCKFSREALESRIEKFRRGETPFVDDKSVFMFCREARPVLKKYINDPDRNIREAVTYFLGFTNSKYNLELLLMQIEKYPLESSLAVQGLSNYSCKDLRQINPKKLKTLSDALIVRVRGVEEDVSAIEFYSLGCLAQSIQPAKEFLEEFRRPSYPTRVGERDREWHLLDADYALAESGDKEAVGRLLAHIDVIDKQDNSRDVQPALIEKIPRISNRILLLRLSPFIKDKRDSNQVNQAKQALRIGDIAVSSFTRALGSKVTGEKRADWRPHTDEELDRIFQRVVSYLQKK